MAVVITIITVTIVTTADTSVVDAIDNEITIATSIIIIIVVVVTVANTICGAIGVAWNWTSCYRRLNPRHDVLRVRKLAEVRQERVELPDYHRVERLLCDVEDLLHDVVSELVLGHLHEGCRVHLLPEELPHDREALVVRPVLYALLDDVRRELVC